MRIAGYIRVSSKHQAKYGYSIAQQERKIKEYFDLSFTNDDMFIVYKDDGYSARSLTRPAIQEIINDQSIDCVIVTTLDRLSRNIRDLTWLLDYFKDLSTTVISIYDDIDTSTTTGKISIYLLSVLAQLEVEMNSNRVRNSILEAVRQGKYIASNVPVGYERSVEDKYKLVQNEAAAKVVKEIFQRYVNGETCTSIAKDLKERNILDMKWCDGEIDEIITRKIYAGVFDWSKRSEDLVYEKFCDPIISLELWEEAQRVKKERSDNVHYYHYLYSDKVICDKCDCQTIHNCTTNRHGKEYQYYRCPCCKKYFSEIRITKCIRTRIEHVAEEYDYTKKTKSYKDKIKRIERSERLLNIDYNNDRISKRYYAELFNRIENQKNSLLNQLETAEQSCNREMIYSDQINDVVDQIRINENKKKIEILYKVDVTSYTRIQREVTDYA